MRARSQLVWLGVRAAVVVVTLVGGAVAVKVVSGAVTTRVRWLANDWSSSADPAWDIPVDGAAIRQAAAFLHSGDTYYVTFSAANAQYSHDVPAAALLFLTPARPVWQPQYATWVLSYQARPLVPDTVRAVAVHRLAAGIFLVRTKPK